VLIFLVLLVPLVQGHGQTKVLATTVKSGTNAKESVLGGGSYQPTTDTRYAEVIGAQNIKDGNESTYATLKAKTVAVIATINGEAWVQTNFDHKIPIETTSYVKVSKVTAGGASLDLGGVLGGLLGLLGDKIFVEAYANAEDSSPIANTNLTTTFVETKSGDLLLAINSKVPYQGIRVKLRSEASALNLLGSKNYEMNVYEAFYYTGDASCGKPLATGVGSVGLNINLLGGLFTNIGTNQYGKSIDNDANSYSVLKGGDLVAVNVGSSISQYFYFPNSAKVNATFNVTLAKNPGAVEIPIISGLEVRAYQGNKEVYVRSLEGGLLNGVDILGLLQRDTPFTLTFAPGKAFDKVEIRLNTAVSIGVAKGGLRIYDVERYDGTTCINPNYRDRESTQVPFETASCVTSLVDFQNVDFATNVLDNNNETYATLYADAGALLASPASQGMIHMAYSNQVPANTTSYIRIDADTDLLNSLVGGTLGKLLGDVLGVVLGNHYFEIEAYNGTTLVSKSTSANGFSSTTGGKMTVVQDRIGRYYLAVTPNQPYQSIKITNKVLSIPNGEIRTLKVYNMCREMGTDACFPPQFTSYDISGINVSVGNLNTAGVTNPYHAISGNSSEYAEISTGLLGVAATVKQMIYFTHPSQGNDQLKARLQLNPSSLLSADLLGRYRIVTYLGDQQQEVFTLQQGLINNLNLLSLFKSGGIQTLTFDTTQLFDRVEIQASTVVGAGVTAPIRLYDVKRVSATCPESSTPSPFVAPVCATQLLDASNANDIGNLFDGNFDSYATLQSGAGFLLGLGNKFEGFVEMGYAATVPANTTSYVRIDFEGSALTKLLGGSLGNLVTGLVDGVLLGRHSFKVTVKDENGNPILEEGSQAVSSSFRNGKIRVVVDKLGRTYLAITPTQAYKTVRITDNTDSLLGLLAQPNTMNVYGMCYETAPATCVAPFATSYEYEGLNYL